MLARRIYVEFQQRRVRQFLKNARRAAALQREVLFEKIRREADSDFGHEHGFHSIRTLDDFRRQVPISGYEYFRPYVERVKKGDTRALFGPNTKMLMFAMTSGTTAASKYIPVTDHFFKEYKRSWNTWGVRTYHQHPELQWRKTLSFSSDWQQSRTEGGFYCGNISGLAADSRPLIANMVFCLPAAINKISGADAKQYTALRLAMARRDIGIIITANPLTLIGLARLADAEKESLIRDIHNGALSEKIELAAPVRAKLARYLRQAKPGRARELAQIAERSDGLWPRDYWQRMSVLAIWIGGSVGAYVPQVREYYGENVTFRDHGLSASEGRMTTPLEDNTSRGILEVGAHYFEFIPEEEHGASDPTILEAHELEPGRNYYLIMSTSSCLWRHDIHDVVHCHGFEGQAPVLEFLNKGAHYSSMTGEKLSEHQVVGAVRGALDAAGVQAEHFTLAPVPGDPAHYELLIEVDLDQVVEQRLADQLNRRLAEVNCEYENRLETGRLLPAVIRQLPPGTWKAFHTKALQRKGASLEQFKHPCLTNKPDFIEKLTGTLASV